MNLICDMKMMEATVREMQYDSEKAPLGKKILLSVADYRVNVTMCREVDCRSDQCRLCSVADGGGLLGAEGS